MPDATFTWAEMAHACHVGTQRRIRALAKGRQPAYGYKGGDEWQIDVEGAGAELLVAKTLGVYCSPVVGALDTETGDVAGLQVKWTKYGDGHLLVARPDPAFNYVLVVGEMPCQHVIGWAPGQLVLDQGPREVKGRTGYWLPQRLLEPLSTLALEAPLAA